jgi:phosphatidylserine decarboxylase
MDLKSSPIILDGLYFALPLVVGAAFLSYIDVKWMSLIFCGLILFVLWFFRNPERYPSGSENTVVSPADGRVLKVEEVRIDDPVAGTFKKISIFMNVLNVHVNRMPVAGTIEKIQYHKGKFLSANLDKASLQNERNAILIRTGEGKAIVTIQIAGLVARRIVCWIEEGMKMERGERFGLIRFGSRLEIFLPTDTTIIVKTGDKVRAGETRIGYLS